MESPSNGDLPTDIILDILLRLPVKSLLRFKCVCKHWCALIGSPSFVNQHFLHESNQERLLIRHDKPNEEGYTFALYVDEMCSGCEEPDYLQTPDTVIDLMGPLNGVFCVLSKSRKFALLNPAMREFKPLPLNHLYVQPHLSIYDDLAGFGFDPLSGDYKVFSARYLLNEETNAITHPRHVSIYNSGSDSWRHIEDVYFVNSMVRADRTCDSTCLNGVYYWVTWLDDGGAAILAFDMSSENFQEIQVPDCVKYRGDDFDLDVALYGDSIALLSYGSDRNDKWVNVWVMKEEGCWTRSSTLGPFEDIIWPLCFWKNAELLIETKETSSLTLCNVSTLKLRTVEARRKKKCRFVYWVFSYKESLVSLKGVGDNCKLWDTSSDFVKDFFR